MIYNFALWYRLIASRMLHNPSGFTLTFCRCIPHVQLLITRVITSVEAWMPEFSSLTAGHSSTVYNKWFNICWHCCVVVPSKQLQLSIRALKHLPGTQGHRCNLYSYFHLHVSFKINTSFRGQSCTSDKSIARNVPHSLLDSRLLPFSWGMKVTCVT